MKVIPVLLILSSLVACGKKKSKSGTESSVTPAVPEVPTAPVTPGVPEVNPTPTPTPTPSPSPTPMMKKGSYNLIQRPLNRSYSRLKGSGSLVINDHSLQIKLSVTGATPLRMIYQELLRGKCPTALDDRNSDGIVDAAELARETAPLLLVDRDLDALKETSIYPIPNLFGSYAYESAGELAAFKKTLLSDGDFDPRDHVIVLRGSAQFLKFPNSVESLEGKPVSETLPVACFEMK